MPTSVENGFRSQEDVDGVAYKHDTPIGEGVVTDSLSDNKASKSYSHLAVQDVMSQLPSPSPTPSPRSSSPSLVVTGSSGEYIGAVSAANGNNHSKSFEKATTTLASSLGDPDEVLLSPLPISKVLPPHELHDIPEERVRKHRKSSASKMSGDERERPVLKLTAAELDKLTSDTTSLPVSPRRPSLSGTASPLRTRRGSNPDYFQPQLGEPRNEVPRRPIARESLTVDSNIGFRAASDLTPKSATSRRPGVSSRAISTPPIVKDHDRTSSYQKPSRQSSPKRKPTISGARPDHLDLTGARPPLSGPLNSSAIEPPSPIPQSIPLPPMSIPTYLQLELASSRPSPLYIHRSAASEYPYESSRIKFERLLNFLLLPPQLEQVLYFGSLACLDAWLYTFTILPLRFFKALGILIQWWGQVLAKEARFIAGFIYHGSGRMWNRQRSGSVEGTRSRSVSRAPRPSASTTASYQTQAQAGRLPDSLNASTNFDNLKFDGERKSRQGWIRRHRRMKSEPSSLSSFHKADLIQGLLIVCSCMILLKLDSSRMYHSIRGQSNVKLYVIYNLLEVCQS